MTDEIAQREGFDTVVELRRAIKIDLQNHKDQEEELRIKEDIFNILVKDAETPPPDSLIDRELKFMIEGMKYQIAQSGMKLEDSGFEPDKAMKEWREKAIFNTTGYMMLESVAAAENIHVTQQDMEANMNCLPNRRTEGGRYPETAHVQSGLVEPDHDKDIGTKSDELYLLQL